MWEVHEEWRLKEALEDMRETEDFKQKSRTVQLEKVWGEDAQI